MISIVIPNYNRCETLLDLLQSIYQQQFDDFEVIVVDDCSTDGSIEIIQNRFPDVRILANERNSGPAVARNRGIRSARGEIVVGLDSDVTLADRLLLGKVADAFITCPKADALAFRILASDGESDDVPRWWHPLNLSKFADRFFYTSYFSGTGYAIKRESAVDSYLFPEIFYMHYEEVELAMRLIDNGHEILYCPDLCVLHHAAPSKGRSRVQMFYKPRNQILLAVSCFTPVGIFRYLLPRLIFQLAKSLKGGYASTFLEACREGLHLSRHTPGLRRPLQISTFRRLQELRKGDVFSLR